MTEVENEQMPPAEPEEEQESAEEATQDGAEQGDEQLPDLPLTSVVEAVLFASPDPLSLARIAKAAGRRVRQDAVRAAIDELNVRYLETGRAFEIAETAGKWQFMSRPEYYQFIARACPRDRSSQAVRALSPAVLETLAVIAYKQPVTRGDILRVRGVDPAPALKTLIERGYVVTGARRTDVIGQPLTYVTTDAFLTDFGLGNLEELPMRADVLAAVETVQEETDQGPGLVVGPRLEEGVPAADEAPMEEQPQDREEQLHEEQAPVEQPQ